MFRIERRGKGRSARGACAGSFAGDRNFIANCSRRHSIVECSNWVLTTSLRASSGSRPATNTANTANAANPANAATGQALSQGAGMPCTTGMSSRSLKDKTVLFKSTIFLLTSVSYNLMAMLTMRAMQMNTRHTIMKM